MSYQNIWLLNPKGLANSGSKVLFSDPETGHYVVVT